MPKTAAHELFFLGADLPSAKLLTRRALEIAYPLLLENTTLQEAVKVRFYKGTEQRGNIDVIVNSTTLREAREISDLLDDDHVIFDLSAPGEPPSVIGIFNREVCLRICLNADQKLQINVGKKAAKAP